jgi:hypothetical protein
MKAVTTMVDETHGEWDLQGLGIDASPEVERATHEALARWTSERVASLADAGSQVMRANARARLLTTLSSEERFRPFFAELDRYLAIGLDALRAVLRKLEVPESYQVAPIPGVRFFHFPPGARSRFAEAGIVKLDKGARFPRHRHLGAEINFVLEGTLIDAGLSYGPGSVVANAAGSAHDYSAGPARHLILVAGHNGITYLEDMAKDEAKDTSA